MHKRFKSLLVVAIIMAMVAVILILLRGNEDSWICVGGSWVKHGMPSAPQPTSPCLNVD